MLTIDFGEFCATRVPISLPCQVPVVPGTGDCTAPIAERTERCAVDAWWMVGKAMMCTLHLRYAMPGVVDEFEALDEWTGFNPREELPWEQMHRYDQADAQPTWKATHV
jgi:hypothetical protein